MSFLDKFNVDSPTPILRRHDSICGRFMLVWVDARGECRGLSAEKSVFDKVSCQKTRFKNG